MIARVIRLRRSGAEVRILLESVMYDARLRLEAPAADGRFRRIIVSERVIMW